MTSELFLNFTQKSSNYFINYKKLLEDFVRFPSIANRDLHVMMDCADWLKSTFDKFGFITKIYPTARNASPVVYAEKNSNAKKTLMFYHHYDVQPENPIALWNSSPWKLTEINNRLFGRGTSDDKGELLISLIGLQLLEDELGELPINVKFIIDGEEEAGSQNLPKFIDKNLELIRAEGCVWEGSTITPKEDGKYDLDSPVELLCGLKGNVDFNLSTTGPPKLPRTDVHSGQAASSPNAAWRMIWALASLKDSQERILIEGFNELVEKPLAEDIEELRNIDSSYELKFKQDYQLDNLLLNRTGLDLLIELILKPSLTVCGIQSGQDQEEIKTIIPSSAKAKLDFRLVPNLTVEKIELLLDNHFKKNGFKDIRIERTSGYNPGKTPVKHPFIKMLKKTTSSIVQNKPTVVYPFAAGSGPAYLFSKYVPICIIQNYVEQLNCHAPNENIPIKTIKPSFALIATIGYNLSRME
ncbi:MAG: M20/M25/M40 family metallo-hydrolase [Candidatus Thorarchaeota archaeon]